MSYAPGAPAQIWAITGISDGAKLTLMHWWSKADHDVQREPRPCTVWAPAGEREDGSRMKPHESLIADLLATVHPGKAERTLRGHIVELTEAGLADVDGRCVDLTPPNLAVPRRKIATPRRKSAGENSPDSGEKSPAHGEKSPASGENPPLHSYPPCPATTPHDPPSGASKPALDDPTPPSPSNSAASRPQPSELLDDPPRPSPPPRRRPRKPSEPKPGQVGLPIDDAPEADADADLLAEHERLRAAALVAAGRQATPLPGKTTRDGRALRLGLRKAVEVHGVEVCSRVLAWQGARWLEDPGQLEWSTHNVWSSSSLAKTIRWSAGPAQAKARASPSRTLPIEPGAPTREYVFDWTEPT